MCIKVSSIKFLGYIGKGLSVDPTKIQVMVDWLAPTTLTALHSFLGLESLNRRFGKDFGDIAAPLTDLTRHKYFQWSEKATLAFDLLKKLVMLLSRGLEQFLGKMVILLNSLVKSSSNSMLII